MNMFLDLVIGLGPVLNDSLKREFMALNGQVETMAEFRDFVSNKFLGLVGSKKPPYALENKNL